MVGQPLICVCIPCYNAEKTMLETVTSIQNQTYKNIEIHVFDNASLDSTVEIVKSIADERIYLHESELTGTAELNFTRCLNLGRGDYTAIFHADDLYDPQMIEKEVQFLESQQHAQGVLTFAHTINEKSEIVSTSYAPAYLKLAVGESRSFELPKLVKAVLRDNNFLFCPSAMIRTSCCTNVLKIWRGDMFGPGADLDTWFRIAESGQLGLINLPLLRYRVSTSHFSYHYNSLKVDRADLFTILDYWMRKTSVSQYLDDEDWHWYRVWLMRDHIVRAKNAVAQGKVQLAKKVLKNVSFMQMLKEAFTSLRSLKFCVLYLLILIRCQLQRL